MKHLSNYINIRKKPSTVKATNDTIKKIIVDSILKFGYDADLNFIDVSSVTNLNRMFRINYLTHERINCDISRWDVSNVTEFSYMLLYCSGFKCDLSEWNVSSGKLFSEMFTGTQIDFDVSRWDMSNAEDTSAMFSYCHKFKGNGLEKWKTNSLKACTSMFCSCEKIDPDFSGWDVSNVTTFDHMFEDCENFTGKGIYNWVIKPKRLYKMFMRCAKLDPKNIDLTKFSSASIEKNMTFAGTPLDKSGTVYL